MRAVKDRDTRPEMMVRRLLHRLGYRYRLHRKDLPGTPDIVFGPRRKVIFVHGCFWHGHSCRRGNRRPVRNAGYWATKINGNVQRYEEQVEALQREGWGVLTIWECTLTDQDALASRLRRFLGGSPRRRIIGLGSTNTL